MNETQALVQARAWLADLFAPWVQALRLSPEKVGPDAVVLRLPFDEGLCRVGGTVCGQALMSAADTAMVIKPGRTLTFGEIEIVAANDGKVAVHAISTCAML